MSTEISRPPFRPPGRPRAFPLMPPPVRKILLVIHVTASAGWIGVEACLLALAARGNAGQPAPAIYTAAGTLGNMLAFRACLLTLATGLLLSLGTPWGLLRHYWVITKLVLTTAVMLADIFTIDPLLSRAAAGLGPGSGPLAAVSAAQIAVLLVTMVITVFKPWGRTGFRPAAKPGTARAGRPAS